MSKYSFDRITPDNFESMAQALLEKTYRIGGNLIQFGPGADGGREATWTQPVAHPNYSRPRNEQTDVPKEWVFQVKYHDIGQRGWGTARDALVEDLEKELSKIMDKHKVPCHAYVMITNVPFTGVRDLGTRDRISVVVQNWRDRIPEIFVWDAADLARLLDANESVRTAYIDTILPGDMIKAIYYHAARFVDSVLATKLASRLKLPDGFSPEDLDAHCRHRFPFRIELRRYAKWIGEEQKNDRPGEMARHIILQGDLGSRTATRLVREWAEAHTTDLLEDWDLARQCKELKKIPPLD